MNLSRSSELILPLLTITLCAVGLVVGLLMIPLQDVSPVASYQFSNINREGGVATFAERFP
jgi:hypothetical protein